MIKYIVLVLIALCKHSQSIPIDVNLIGENNTNLDFALNLPNNQTVQIGLSFRLLTYSDINNEGERTTTNPNILNTENEYETTLDPITAITERNKRKVVSVEEAIEGFRQDLIRKESEIGGIIESKGIFFRHFKLEFDEDKSITVRCTYDSNYEKRTLKISCYEYHEFETERVLSNGEVELIRQHDPNHKSDIELVDLKQMKQTYNMSIS